MLFVFFKVSEIFSFYFLINANLRRRHGGGGLEVVAVEVALEVEVGEHIALRHTEKRLELGIRLDGVLLLEVLLLHVGRDGLRDVGAGLLGARRAA